jgi:DeoR/GlpR family transcriptional regulator of sugar metabolism
MASKDERLRKIVEWIDREGHLSVKDLSARLEVSTMTVWRDLGDLEQAGEIRRVRGGGARAQDPVAEEPSVDNKAILHNREKCSIAQYVAENLVGNDQIIILEGGTTVSAMVPYLTKNNLTVLTNGLYTLLAASELVPQLTVMGCGGMLRSKSLTFVGPQAETFFENVHADQFFLGGTGLTLVEGVTDPSPLEIQMKRAMHRAAKRTVLMMDSSKFGRRSLAQILPLEEVGALVTDPEAPPEMLDQLRSLGIDVHIACAPPDNAG